MKKLFLILFLVSIINVIPAQNNLLSKSVLFIPINSDMCIIGKQAKDILQYNDIKPKEVIKDFKSIIKKQIQSEFKFYTIDNLCVNYSSVCDSLHKYKLYNNFNMTDTSSKKPKFKNYNSYTNQYYSRTIDAYNEAIIKAIVEKSKIDYIIMINCFEISKRNIWSNKTYFELHCEIFNKELNRIYGGKNSYSRVISKNMYVDVLKHYSQMSIANQLKYVKKTISKYYNLSPTPKLQ